MIVIPGGTYQERAKNLIVKTLLTVDMNKIFLLKLRRMFKLIIYIGSRFKTRNIILSSKGSIFMLLWNQV